MTLEAEIQKKLWKTAFFHFKNWSKCFTFIMWFWDKSLLGLICSKMMEFTAFWPFVCVEKNHEINQSLTSLLVVFGRLVFTENDRQFWEPFFPSLIRIFCVCKALYFETVKHKAVSRSQDVIPEAFFLRSVTKKTANNFQKLWQLFINFMTSSF